MPGDGDCRDARDLERRVGELAAALRERMRTVEADIRELEAHRGRDMQTVENLQDKLDSATRAAWIIVAELVTGLAGALWWLMSHGA